MKRTGYFAVSLITISLACPCCFQDVYAWGDENPSIHFTELWQHAGSSHGYHDQISVTRGDRQLTHMVYGWYPYWMGSTYTGFQWDLLSHISFFSLEADSTGNIIDYHGWPDSWPGLIASAEAAGVKITLTCTLFSSSGINTLIQNTTYRNRLITNLIDACLDGGADGINIDFEGTSLDKIKLVTFMQELESALRAAIPTAHLSMATPSVDWTACFDYDELGYVCDALIPMCYGYHWGGGNPGPVSPLTSSSLWGTYCIEWTTDDYLDPGYGTTADKLALGLPYYGYDWLVSGDPSAVPASDGSGDGVSRTYTFIRSNHSAYNKHWDANSQTPYYYYYSGSDPRQVWFDDAQSLALKYQFAKVRNLNGIAIWALGYDGSYPDLWQVLEDEFAVEATPTPMPQTGILDGRVQWQRPGVDPPDDSWVEDVEIELCGEMAGDVVETDNEGYFSVVLTSGNWDVKVSGMHTLATIMTDVFIPGGGQTGLLDFGVLPEGNASGDNAVTSADLWILKDAYNSLEGEIRFNENADFNNDGAVTSFDFIMMKAWYNTSGSECP